jgi:hypothetical protein
MPNLEHRPSLPLQPAPQPQRLVGLGACGVRRHGGADAGQLSRGRRWTAGQYYAHPQNHFWRILQAIWPRLRNGCPAKAAMKSASLAAGAGPGPVGCIRLLRASGQPGHQHPQRGGQRFAASAARLPRLRAIAHNGGESFKPCAHTASALGLPVHRCPPPARPTPAGVSRASWRPGAKWCFACARVVDGRDNASILKKTATNCPKSISLTMATVRHLHLGTALGARLHARGRALPTGPGIRAAHDGLAAVRGARPRSPSATPCSWAWARRRSPSSATRSCACAPPPSS